MAKKNKNKKPESGGREMVSAVSESLGIYSPESGQLFVFLLLVCVSLSGPVDAQGTSSPLVGQEADGNRTTTESFLPSTAEEPEAENMTASPLNFQQRENASLREETSVAEVEKTKGITPSSVSFTSAAEVTQAQQPSVDQRRRTDVWKVDYQENVFHYDYYSLRKGGLIAAAILFILGILILTCGKNGKSRCRGKKRTRNYDVTPA
ncbi:FXYD domain-containing ion transport regulator 5-like isoform X2 [Podarcis raffonei]|uniref:FXYD domain-containing ion transport regulator 5-like isoform X2 n=1 Tax=Podarcis raffonei TaxID=65483 RepID=UPI0023294483|nr:FXYD domain-containing ion transport regulator 5-like isoform X2 [Podarcis raffonei]